MNYKCQIVSVLAIALLSLTYSLQAKDWSNEPLAAIQLAAEQGNESAQLNLGLMYYQGRGVAQDDLQAAAWYRKAAEQGNAIAQFNLGMMYYEGRGVEQADLQAVTWWRKAAEQGDVTAQLDLGLMYYEGRGVGQSALQAVTWWRKAAEQGLAMAQFNLGVMYDRGLGVVQDKQQAQAWYRKAAEQGHAEAQKALNAEPPKKQWWIVDSSYTECFETGGPAAKLDEFVGFADKPSTQDFTGPDGKLVKVEVINGNGYGQDTVWTFYTTKQMCEAEQVNVTKSLADKYR